MKLSRLFSFFALALATLLPATLSAQVKATLVADVTSVQPGQPFTAAVRLVHDGHWHTYWINPGTGLATSLSWTLPTGAMIRWDRCTQ